ncbi:hypothetical protein CAEBREN_03960 [Caenorhabditis brenneri]|uniref:RING-type domain-containing protein n=1 Tax=Caenorhabditis brenneri TaxID=135651 RepID=G0MWU3_CAEBE|nr:hypothetical protein CAEBREN_03960 [Caenorhabditis brenneri]
MCQFACSVASAFAFAEFARVWWVGVQLIEVNGGMNEVDVQPVEPSGASIKISLKPEPEPLGKAVAPKPSCNICSIPYTETGIHTPRIIKACGHTICERCADSLLEVKKDNFLKCPFCLKVTVVNGPAAILAKNFALLEYETEVVERIKDIYKAAKTDIILT